MHYMDVIYACFNFIWITPELNWAFKSCLVRAKCPINVYIVWRHLSSNWPPRHHFIILTELPVCLIWPISPLAAQLACSSSLDRDHFLSQSNCFISTGFIERRELSESVPLHPIWAFVLRFGLVDWLSWVQEHSSVFILPQATKDRIESLSLFSLLPSHSRLREFLTGRSNFSSFPFLSFLARWLEVGDGTDNEGSICQLQPERAASSLLCLDFRCVRYRWTAYLPCIVVYMNRAYGATPSLRRRFEISIRLWLSAVCVDQSDWMRVPLVRFNERPELVSQRPFSFFPFAVSWAFFLCNPLDRLP